MQKSLVLLVILAVSCSCGRAQTRAQNQEKLVQFLASDLTLTQDQTSTVRGFITQADQRMATYEVQNFGKPELLARRRREVTMELGKKIETILTPEQLAQYPKTKKKVYDAIQKRFEVEMKQVQGSQAKPNEMIPAETQK